MDKHAAIIMTQTKSTGLAVLLTLLFGGFGVFYATTLGGIVMAIVELIGWALVVVTLGFGIVLVPVIHVIALIWCVVAVNNHNKQLIAGAIV